MNNRTQQIQRAVTRTLIRHERLLESNIALRRVHITIELGRRTGSPIHSTISPEFENNLTDEENGVG